MNRKDVVNRLGLLLARGFALSLFFQLSACGGGGGSESVAPPPIKHCIENCTVAPFNVTSNFALLETQSPFPGRIFDGRWS